MHKRPPLALLGELLHCDVLLLMHEHKWVSLVWCADIEIQANEILHHKLTLNGYLAEFTGQSMETITQVGTSHIARLIRFVPHEFSVLGASFTLVLCTGFLPIKAF